MFHVEQDEIWPLMIECGQLLDPAPFGGMDAMARTQGFLAHLVRSPDGEGSGSEQRIAPKKTAVVSRLGRGLGALIPPSAPRPASHSANAVQVKDAAPPEVSNAATPVDLPAVVKVPAESKPAAAPAVLGGSAIGSSTGLVGRTPADKEPKNSTESKVAIQSRSTWNTSADQTIEMIPIARIQRNPRQPRERFDDGALRALADSIRQDGLLQPIVVRPVIGVSGPAQSPLYELIAGERRLRAFTMLGRSAIPAIVQAVDDRTSAVLALIENVQREDLNPMERAHGLQRLMHEFELSQQDLASRVGLDRSTVANLLRLNDLDPHTAGALREGAITTGHAKALLGLSDVAKRRVLLTRAIAEGLSVRELEREARAAGSVASSGAPNRLASSGRVISAQIADLERRIAAHLGTEVELKSGRKPGSGSITIRFSSHSQFEGLMDRIGFDLEASDRPRGR